jgi:hypothetical protein
MARQPDQEWNELDTETPNAARMYDYLLGGAANFAADRAKVGEIERTHPQLRRQARANRSFLRRVVRHLACEAGVRQFLDLGSGVPTVGHVHEIAQRAAPDARVVYVDSEPVAATYSRHYLSTVPHTALIQEDLRHADTVLDQAAELLDLTRPVAVLMFAVLPFIQDDAEVTTLVTTYRDHTVPGSYLAISGVRDDDPTAQRLADQYTATTQPWKPRSHDAMLTLFTGYDLIPPGLVPAPD